MAVRAQVACLLLLGAVPALAQEAAPSAVRSETHVSVDGKAPPAAELHNPVKADSATVAEGRRLFEGFNCAGCHGGGAVGNMGPSLADGRWRYGGSDGEILHSIFYGRPRGMPAFGGAIPTVSIWRIVVYLRSLQPAKDTLSTTAW
jgi:cytochrome c oxidase cbb3-type subunit 3